MNLKSIRGLLVIPVAVATLISSVSADSYTLMLRGQRSGVIKGSVTQKGREGAIQVLDIDHSIISPRDPASGLPTGQRQHKPFIVTIQLDQSAPLLYNALSNNENLTAFELKYWAPSSKSAGTEANVFTVRLSNSNISSIEQFVEKDQTGVLRTYLKVSFNYQRIQWTWTDGGITATDDWAGSR